MIHSKLKKNLISLGTKDSKGFKYISGGERFYAIHFVCSSNGCEFGCNLSISKFKINLITITWFGHIGEKGMTILSNQCLHGNHKVVKLDFMNIL